MIIQSITTALSTGLGCGTCCGTGMSAFLFGYLTTHAKDMKHSFMAYISFYAGKILAVALLCTLSSFLGQQIIDENGYSGIINIHLIVNLCMIAMALWFIYKWFRNRKKHNCEKCNHSCTDSSGAVEAKILKTAGNSIAVSYPAMAIMGAAYGISPCAPLLMMAGYAISIRPAAAFLTGSIFALASAFVPLMLLMILTGVLSSRLYKEIPGYIDIFRLLSYIVLIVICVIDIF